jgi:hypothetical protein
MSALIDSIYNRRLEVHYNEKYIRTETGQRVKIELKGKVRCPLLNINISSIVCSKFMDKEGWCRSIDPNVCNRLGCYICKSILKYQKSKALSKPKI